jgi:hypothetical protein
MNRLALVPCVVVAFCVALASYIAWPIVVYNLGGSRVGLSAASSVANHGESLKGYSAPIEQTSSAFASYEVANKPMATPEKSAHAVSPGTNYHESTWVTVLLPARVHTGPSVDTPITHFYVVGTSLRATRYWNDWIEVIESGASKSGWIYRKYLGAISNSEHSKIASLEMQAQNPVAQSTPTKRYAKARPEKRHANSSSKQSTRVEQATVKPTRSRTEMASLLQRAFSGY